MATTLYFKEGDDVPEFIEKVTDGQVEYLRFGAPVKAVVNDDSSVDIYIQEQLMPGKHPLRVSLAEGCDSVRLEGAPTNWHAPPYSHIPRFG